MSLACPHCGAVIEAQELEQPHWLAELIEGLTESRPRLKWHDSWSVKLMAEDFETEVIWKVVDAIIAHDKTYKDYYRAVRNWYARELERQAQHRTNGHKSRY